MSWQFGGSSDAAHDTGSKSQCASPVLAARPTLAPAVCSLSSINSANLTADLISIGPLSASDTGGLQAPIVAADANENVGAARDEFFKHIVQSSQQQQQYSQKATADASFEAICKSSNKQQEQLNDNAVGLLFRSQDGGQRYLPNQHHQNLLHLHQVAPNRNLNSLDINSSATTTQVPSTMAKCYYTTADATVMSTTKSVLIRPGPAPSLSAVNQLMSNLQQDLSTTSSSSMNWSQLANPCSFTNTDLVYNNSPGANACNAFVANGRNGEENIINNNSFYSDFHSPLSSHYDNDCTFPTTDSPFGGGGQFRTSDSDNNNNNIIQHQHQHQHHQHLHHDALFAPPEPPTSSGSISGFDRVPGSLLQPNRTYSSVLNSQRRRQQSSGQQPSGSGGGSVGMFALLGEQPASDSYSLAGALKASQQNDELLLQQAFNNQNHIAPYQLHLQHLEQQYQQQATDQNRLFGSIDSRSLAAMQSRQPTAYQHQQQQQQQQQQQRTRRGKTLAPFFGKTTAAGSASGVSIFGTTGSSDASSGPQAVDTGERFSRKVFAGGLPPDIDEDEIKASFSVFGPLVVDWPHKAESKSYFPPKGYAFLLFHEEASVQSLIDSCHVDKGKLYLSVSSPTSKNKLVQIRPWRLSDANYVIDSSSILDPRTTVFVGGVPRPLKASELANFMNMMYGGVCYAGIDTDPDLKYPKGAGRVAFSNRESYLRSVAQRFVKFEHAEFEKRVEIKPYVLDDQICDECNGAHSASKFAPFFCANIACLRYYCDFCWQQVHSSGERQFHKPLVKESVDRPRVQSNKWP